MTHSRTPTLLASQAQSLMNRLNVFPTLILSLTSEEINSVSELAKRNAFDAAIKLKLGDSMSLPVASTIPVELSEADRLQEPDESSLA